MDTTAQNGFVPIPRAALDRLLLADARLGETRVALLVLRLTYGCRNCQWARLRPSDLLAVGIGPTHARECLRRAEASGLVERNGLRDEYRVAPHAPAPAPAARRERLDKLVGLHLGQAWRERSAALPIPAPAATLRREEPEPRPVVFTPSATSIPKAVSYADPGGYGASAAGRRWRFDRDAKRFVRDPEPIPCVSAPPTSLPNLQQAAEDLFAPSSTLPQSRPTTKASAR